MPTPDPETPASSMPLSDYVHVRLAELQPEEARLEAQLAAVRREMDGLRRAARAIGDESVPQIRGRPRAQGTIQDFAVQIIAEHPVGVTANEIRDLLRERFGREVTRESLAPQLSRLNQAGRIRHVGNLYLPLAETADHAR